jgi:alkaline phosphatase D
VLKRRDFLKLTGTFFATASLAGVPGCGDNDGGGGSAGDILFNEGVASGDPRTDRVVLWTRCVRKDPADAADISLVVEVASDERFETIVVSQDVTASASADFTVRVVVDGLMPDRYYYYRFVAGVDEVVGRTRTAPAADADVAVNFAWVSCQDYGAGYFTAYKQMIADDQARPEAEQIRFVVHLGDFIYESNGEGYHAPLNENLEPIQIMNADGTPRVVGDFPSGGGELPLGRYARDLSDYRFLYRRFLSDPDLRAARARWPFIQTWDDHEFSNDCWQSQANYTDDSGLNEAQQPRKVAANQAWFEYVPALLSGLDASAPGVSQQAKDFAAVTVAEAAFVAPNADNFVAEDNNVKAVGSMTIYRSLRWGKHIDLIITDQRSYRSDHAIPEEIAVPPLYFDPRNAVPKDVVDRLDAGTAEPRMGSPKGTMLGKAQREWFQATLKGSTATWKIWGNEVPLFQVVIVDPVAQIERVMSADAWDGYPSERRDLMTYIKDQDIKNVLVITGDIHAHFASTIFDDFDKPSDRVVVAAELCAAGVASNSLFSFYEDASRRLAQFPELRKIVTFDGSAGGGPRFVENLNTTILHGQATARAVADGATIEAALQQRVTTNDHVKYADTNAQGYGLLRVTATGTTADIVTVNRPIADSANGPGKKRTAHFTVPLVAGNEAPTLEGPTFTGTPPFPFNPET